MTSKEQVKHIIAAIKSVQIRAKESLHAGNFTDTANLMADLHALELCLVLEVEHLIANDKAA